MIEQADLNTDFGDIEEMIRAAGGYLEVSDDLRPRTLEAARDDRRESSTRSWIAVLAVGVIFIAMFGSQIRGRFSSTSPPNAAVSANGDQLYAAAQRKATQANVDASWSLADSFSELRQRQASLLQDAF